MNILNWHLKLYVSRYSVYKRLKWVVLQVTWISVAIKHYWQKSSTRKTSLLDYRGTKKTWNIPERVLWKYLSFTRLRCHHSIGLRKEKEHHLFCKMLQICLSAPRENLNRTNDHNTSVQNLLKCKPLLGSCVLNRSPRGWVGY